MILIIILLIVVAILVINIKYKKLEAEVLQNLGFPNWNIIPYFDANIVVKSRQALENYDETKFFKEDKGRLEQARKTLARKREVGQILTNFLDSNEYEKKLSYNKLSRKIGTVITNAEAYRICVTYISTAGNNLGTKEIAVFPYTIDRLEANPALLMGKAEYNKFLKEQQKEDLSKKQHQYYDSVNAVVAYANEKRDTLFIKDSAEQLDNLMLQLFDRTVNSIKKIKSLDSEEWDIIGNFIEKIKKEIQDIVNRNERILAYYESADFIKIKETCEALMGSQREFNEYITEKVGAISSLFGTRTVRNETVVDDEFQFVRPYKKVITPFTAEVSAAVFASAENNPLDYVIKNFYPNKAQYPSQIQNLHQLIEELATLREAKEIINKYKAEYQQYLADVPDFVMKEDEAGFYSRLGFANVDESALVVEYKFSYTSGGGMAKRYFTVPMTEETIVELIKALEGKLSASAFTKEQRALMTSKLREHIKNRDNFTCCNCGNSVHVEPNLLLEIDHIIPVSKGGCTVEENLQTLCWKCNRTKGSKIIV